MLVAVADLEIDRRASSKMSNHESQIIGPFSDKRLRNLLGQLRSRLLWLDFTIPDYDELELPGAALSDCGPALGATTRTKAF
jgi:hypothetical protein